MHHQIRVSQVRLLAFGLFSILMLHLNLSSFQDTSEFAQLVHFMNDHTNSKPGLESVSTFNWSSVKSNYLPGPEPLTLLPQGRPLKLPRVQYKFSPETSQQRQTRELRRESVRKLFSKNWKSYRTFAWKKDALLPISRGSRKPSSGWAATLVGSLDSLWIMGLRDEFDEAVREVAAIDFGISTRMRVQTLETTNRYLGGLLAAYDLSGRRVLLTKCVELGNMLYRAFDTENLMPVDVLDFLKAMTGKPQEVEESVGSASPGTLSMEMTRLSQVTGDPKYYAVIERLMKAFELGQSHTRIPGLWPKTVSMRKLDLVSGNEFTLGGGSNTLYEYLPKMHALLGSCDPKYATMSKAFMDAAEQHLIFRPMLPGGEDILISGSVSIDLMKTSVFDPASEHLACSIGATYALAGKLFKAPKYVETGARLARGCVYAYRAMPTGIMPENYTMVPCPGGSKASCLWDEKVWEIAKKARPGWEKHLPKGFTEVQDPRYLLRAEAIESVFVLWRVTGRQEYEEAAWDMFNAVANGTATEIANAVIRDVTTLEGLEDKEDIMGSFWLAETLKYYYLVFSPPDVISLDEFVLNTEAHPFRRPNAKMVSRPLI